MPLIGETTLAAFSKSLANTAVDVFVYDTSKDSDGGAWRKRTGHTTWYNETLNTATRGSRKEFPSVALLVATTTSLIIYDADDSNLPMWMIFNAGGTNGQAMIGRSSESTTSIHALNGWIVVGRSSFGLHLINFIKDYAEFKENGYDTPYVHPIGTHRNSNNEWLALPADRGNDLLNDLVNDVTMAVMPNAKVDSATGLPTPHIAVATNGGVTLIDDSGIAHDYTPDTIQHHTPRNIKFIGNRIFFTSGNNYDSSDWNFHIAPIIAENVTQPYSSKLSGWTKFNARRYDISSFGSDFSLPLDTETPRTRVLISNSNDTLFLGGVSDANDNGGVIQVHLNDGIANTTLTSSRPLIQWMGKDFNTGWQTHSMIGSWLNGTAKTTLTSTDLLGGIGAFSSSSGWSVASPWSIGSGVATSNGGSGYLTPTTNILVAEKQYIVQFTVTSYTSGTLYMYAGAGAPGTERYYNGTSSAGTYTFYLTAYSTQFGIYSAAFNGSIDNVVVYDAEPNRAAGNAYQIRSGLKVTGSITRAAAMTDSDVVAYSGFEDISGGTKNYFEQTIDTAIGTGDFCIMLWVKPTTSSGYDHYVSLGGQSSSTGFTFKSQRTGNGASPYFYTGSGSTDFGTYNMNNLMKINKWSMLVGGRKSNVFYIYINGELVRIGSTDSMDITNKSLRVGAGHPDESTTSAISMVRVSNIFPTDDQIRKMYNDEVTLFQENSKAVLYGSSDQVTAIAYDEDTKLLHVGTSSGRSVFDGLRRVENTTTAVGNAISAVNGLVAEE